MEDPPVCVFLCLHATACTWESQREKCLMEKVFRISHLGNDCWFKLCHAFSIRVHLKEIDSTNCVYCGKID